MPGPKAERPTYKRDAEYTRGNEKVTARIAKRVAAYDAVPQHVKIGFTKPGSQNRNK